MGLVMTITLDLNPVEGVIVDGGDDHRIVGSSPSGFRYIVECSRSNQFA